MIGKNKFWEEGFAHFTPIGQNRTEKRKKLNGIQTAR
jgi:hypothetical protein